MLIITRNLVITFILIFAFAFTSQAANTPDVSAYAAVLVDGDTGEILYEKNSLVKRSMASTTKIMTALIAVESGRLEDLVTVRKKPYIEGTAIGFNKGDTLTVRDLCYALLLESGNDAALLIAEYFSESEENFSLIMNKKAAELGMKNTNFVTASGLDAKEHYTTAYDMAILGAYAVKNSAFREICSTKNYKAEYIEPDITRYFSNHNRLLTSCEGVIGIKTGFTKKSGRCLVSACERNGKVLVAVTLNAPDDWNDHKKLYDYGYSLYGESYIDIDIPVEISVKGSEKSSVKLNGLNNIKGLFLKNSSVTTKVYLSAIQYAPVKTYDTVGKIVVYQNGAPVLQRDIIASESADIIVNHKIFKATLSQRIADFFKNIFSKER